MLASASAFEFERVVYQLLVQPLGGFALLWLGRVDQVGDVEVAVAHVADDVVGQAW